MIAKVSNESRLVVKTQGLLHPASIPADSTSFALLSCLHLAYVAYDCYTSKSAGYMIHVCLTASV